MNAAPAFLSGAMALLLLTGRVALAQAVTWRIDTGRYFYLMTWTNGKRRLEQRQDLTRSNLVDATRTWTTEGLSRVNTWYYGRTNDLGRDLLLMHSNVDVLYFSDSTKTNIFTPIPGLPQPPVEVAYLYLGVKVIGTELYVGPYGPGSMLRRGGYHQLLRVGPDQRTGEMGLPDRTVSLRVSVSDQPARGVGQNLCRGDGSGKARGTSVGATAGAWL
jgi:hypothetical protein